MARFTNIGLARKSFVQSSAQERASGGGDEGQQRGSGGGERGERGRGRGRGRGGFGARGGGFGGRGGGRGGRGGYGGYGGRGGFGGEGRGGWGRDPNIARQAKFAAERADFRRQKRADERNLSTTCFACRGVGHAARDCPNILAAAAGAAGSAAMLEADEMARKAGIVGGDDDDDDDDGDDDDDDGDDDDGSDDDEGDGEGEKPKGKGKDKGKGKKTKGKDERTGGQVTGGKCYRCNSSAHSLSRCPAPIDPENPTPFATCFVCLATGHLSAACPKNPRGVYVNGGECKICHSVAHRAKDCPTQRPEIEDAPAPRGQRGAVVLGTGAGAGADEDDFMVERRRTATPGDARGVRAKHAPAKNGLRGPAKRPGDDGAYDADSAPPKPKKKKVVSF